MYGFASIMVATSALGGPIPLYEDVYKVGEHDQGVYLPTWVAAY
jgi:hypothetical protein